jgi:hypothetical protein
MRHTLKPGQVVLQWDRGNTTHTLSVGRRGTFNLSKSQSGFGKREKVLSANEGALLIEEVLFDPKVVFAEEVEGNVIRCSKLFIEHLMTHEEHNSSSLQNSTIDCGRQVYRELTLEEKDESQYFEMAAHPDYPEYDE